jgi:predicted phage tail protein
MPRRIAATLSLIIFAVTLVAGAFQAGNSFSTVVLRAILAMAGTFVIGLVLGGMAQRMLDENMSESEKKIKNNQGNAPPT